MSYEKQPYSKVVSHAIKRHSDALAFYACAALFIACYIVIGAAF